MRQSVCIWCERLVHGVWGVLQYRDCVYIARVPWCVEVIIRYVFSVTEQLWNILKHSLSIYLVSSYLFVCAVSLQTIYILHVCGSATESILLFVNIYPLPTPLLVPMIVTNNIKYITMQTTNLQQTFLLTLSLMFSFFPLSISQVFYIAAISSVLEHQWPRSPNTFYLECLSLVTPI